jgi:hypothetical protein
MALDKVVITTRKKSRLDCKSFGDNLSPMRSLRPAVVVVPSGIVKSIKIAVYKDLNYVYFNNAGNRR